MPPDVPPRGAVDPVDHWRPATEADLPALATLYRAAADALGPAVYTPLQVAAWRSMPDDAVRFRAWVLDVDTELACDASDTPLGFCGLSAAGHVQALYVRPDAGRRGIGTRLLARALARGEAAGITAFDAWATPFSRPVFLRHGFVTADTVQGMFQGVMFERYRVTRS